jgi:hypothetical protein
MNFIVKPYDPIDEAIELLQKFNTTPATQQQYSEDELLALISHRVRTHDHTGA